MGLFSSLGDFAGKLAGPALAYGATTLGVPPALAAGGLGFLGQLQTNQTNQDIASSNSAFNAEQAQLNRDFQAQQSATAYQRATADMQAAGLNPMLAYMQGGASTPSGSSAQAANVQVSNPVSAGVDAYSSYTSAGQAEASTSQIYATTDKIREEIKNVPLEGQRLKYVMQELAESAALMAQKGETEVSIRKMQSATISNLLKDGTLKQYDIDAIAKFDNFSKEYKQYAPIIDLVKTIFAPRSGGITINK